MSEKDIAINVIEYGPTRFILVNIFYPAFALLVFGVIFQITQWPAENFWYYFSAFLAFVVVAALSHTRKDGSGFAISATALAAGAGFVKISSSLPYGPFLSSILAVIPAIFVAVMAGFLVFVSVAMTYSNSFIPEEQTEGEENFLSQKIGVITRISQFVLVSAVTAILLLAHI